MGKSGKVDVCHIDDEEGTFKTISISKNALDAHLNHGDLEGSCADKDNLNLLCDDSNACTIDNTGDAECLSTRPPVDCDDVDPFTADSCDPGTGCVHVDIDECDLGTDNCLDTETCNNLVPGFECVDNDECDLGTDNCLDTETCNNLVPGFECVDNDECDLGTDNCLDTETCNNLVPGFECVDNNECCDNGMGEMGEMYCYTQEDTVQMRAKLACESHFGVGNCCIITNGYSGEQYGLCGNNGFGSTFTWHYGEHPVGHCPPFFTIGDVVNGFCNPVDGIPGNFLTC